MSVITNKNTTGQGMSSAGRTGTQVIKFIPSPRVYVKTADVLIDTPVQDYFTKSNGTTPAGWTDLGTVLGNVKVVYDTKVNMVKTGPDQVFRAAYETDRMGTLEFSLEQLDDVVLEQVSGLTASVIQSGSVINYQVGARDLNQLAILLVTQNKLDGKELQFYNPNAYLQFQFEESGDALALKVNGFVPFFTPDGASDESCFSVTVFK